MAFDLTAVLRLNDKYSAPMRKATGNTQAFNQATKKAGGSLKNMGKNMRDAGTSMSKYVSLPLAGVATAAIATVTTFDDSMAKVRAISGASGDDFDALRKKAQELGSTTAHSASQVAEAMSYQALAGWEANQILEATPGLLSLASAGQLDLARTSDIVTDTMSQFRMEADEANRASDIFAKTQAEANTDVQLLGEAMRYAGGEAGAAGMSLAQTNAILGTFANTGLKGSTAGTTFVAMLRDMRGAAEDGMLSVGDMSVALYDAEGNMRDMGSVLTDIEEATKGMDGATRDAALSQIFQTEAMKGVNSFLQQGSGAYKDLEESILDSDGAAADMAETMEDTIGGAFRAMKSAVEGVLLLIGDDLKGVVREGAEFIGMLGGAFSNLDPNIRRLISTFGIIAAVIPTLVIGLGAVMTVIGSLSMPIIAVVAGIGLLIAAFASVMTSSEGFRDNVVGFFTNFRDNAMNALTATGEKLRNWWSENGEQLMARVQSGLITVGEFLTNFWTNYGQPFVQLAIEVFTAVATFIGSQVARIRAFFDEHGAMILQALGNIASFVMGVFMFIWPALSALIQSVWGNIQGVISGAISVITGIIQTFAALFTGNWSAMWDGIKQVVVGAVQLLWNLFQLWFVGKLVAVVKMGAKLIVRFFQSNLRRIVSTARKLLRRVQTFFQNMFGKAQTAVSNALSKAGTAVSNFFSPLMNFLRKAKGLWDDFTGALSKFKMPKAVSSVISGAGKLAGNVVNRFIPGNYHGLESVPYDGYTTRLHKGEAVLPREEAKAYREGRSSGGGGANVTISIANMNVRHEEDIDRIADRLANIIDQAGGGGAKWRT